MKSLKNIIAVSALVLCFFSAQAQNEISPERKIAIDSLAMEKVRDLSKYVSIIGNKETPFSEANRVIDRAMELFADGSQMGVSSVNRKAIKYYGIREYFKRLMALNYDRVTIEWFNIQYISDLELQPDGRYVGVITIYQRFEGESDDGLKYVDTTKKDITVYVERKSTQISGRTIKFWDVLLGDIRVSETSKG
ncbi:hypothetical protein R9C00_28135 [Flammeovirgaceae bacterium SG7u.111]|nr:hypothetical protein [Flammeovirgaceae bacterium SG7u.132]WPO35571.1 hypothetical protein R9C00_28135 [Flammeovirgaceae bacterium SG7u.111]